MGTEVSWLVELAVKPGQLESLRALTREMVEAARGEPGTLVYEWFVSDDGSAVHVYERYADSAAVVVHGASFVENFVERFLEAVEPTRFTVYGSPDAAARETLSALAPAYLGPFDGFAR